MGTSDTIFGITGAEESNPGLVGGAANIEKTKCTQWILGRYITTKTKASCM
jgi:hypothetical protein